MTSELARRYRKDADLAEAEMCRVAQTLAADTRLSVKDRREMLSEMGLAAFNAQLRCEGLARGIPLDDAQADR